MPSPEKQIHIQTFSGGMNSDIAPELLPPDTARYILNCLALSAGNMGVITNLKGNTEVEFDLPSGYNQMIGHGDSEENDKFYYLVYNSNGYHGLYGFDRLTRSITKYMIDLEDTGNVPVLNLSLDNLILHFDIVDGDKAYWVDGRNEARKANLKKLLDKSDTGYGPVIQESFITQYKRTSIYSPRVSYFSDPDKKINRLYGAIRKFAVRFIYDDFEYSSWSDFSEVPLPSFEPYSGINVIPTDNNGIEVIIETGDRTVVKIEIGVQSTAAQASEVSTYNWESVVTLDKRKLGITDNSYYRYKFYNDSTYPVLDQNKVLQPYSFMMRRPLCQAVTKNSITHTNGEEGWPIVDIDIDIDVTYEDLFIDPGTENELNEPGITFANPIGDYVGAGSNVTDYKGKVTSAGIYSGGRRFTQIVITIGADVKEGNKFEIYMNTGNSNDNFYFTRTAGKTDTAETIANKLKQDIIGSERVFRKTPDIPDSNIYENQNSAGNISFKFIMRSVGKNYFSGSAFVNPVEFETLKDTGQSISNQKMGGSEKFAIGYQDIGRKSLGYTDDTLIKTYETVNEQGGFKKIIRTISINHRPPKEALYWFLLRSPDLTYGSYIQMLIQEVVPVNDDDAKDYLDLLVGSLFTYQKIHPNTELRYDFTKGDRLRLIKKTEDDTYYDFFETEVISYNASVVDDIRSNLVTNGTNEVTVSEANIGNVGKFIQVDNVERLIVDAPNGNTYALDNVIGDTTAKTYLSYSLIDRRGTIRIRKPSDITIENQSLVEIYKPANINNPLGSKQFYEFQKKFPILNPGTDNAYHGGETQDQSAGQSAIVVVSDGTTYVRNRELPINNTFPGTQLTIETIEDQSFSDFYPSLMNDNGRVNAEDNGQGVVQFEDRTRFSSIFIEDTKINGFNDFENLNREDFNDQYGAIMLTKFDMNRILLFKKRRTAYTPVDARMTQDNSGVILNVSSDKLLNPIQYFAYEGGVGDNPESFVSNGTQKYWACPNEGVVVRLGGNGEEPISETFYFSKDIQDLFQDAIKNKARIYGGFDRKNAMFLITIEGYKKYVYFDGFNGWITETPLLPNSTTFQIVTSPSNGTATIVDGYKVNYTPNTGFVGNDNFTYRAFIGGVWSSPRKACIAVLDTPSETAWRADFDDYTCVLDQYGLKTGYLMADTLIQFYVYDQTPTGVTKPNVIGDPDFVGAIYDATKCVPQPADVDPNPFTFDPIVDADLSTEYISEVANITGINVAVPISVNIGKYAKNGGAFTNVPGTVVNGDYIELQLESEDGYSESNSMIVTVSSYSTSFQITTAGLFGNELRSQQFRRNNCTPPAIGSLVTYSVPANSYFSSSIAAANALADADIADNGQNYANDPSQSSSTCLMPAVRSIAVFDMYNDSTLNVCAYIDTPGVSESGTIVARNGLNFFGNPAEPAENYMLSSDEIVSGSLRRRFQFNIGKLIGLYPDDVAIPQFIYKIRGRSQFSGAVNGQYSLKSPDRQMGMNGSPGSYIPTVTPVEVNTTNWNSNVISDADGTVGNSVGNVILTITYNRALNTLTVTGV